MDKQYARVCVAVFHYRLASGFSVFFLLRGVRKYVDEAYNEGYLDGREAGLNNNQSFEDARKQGYREGWDDGHVQGREEGFEEAREIFEEF